MSIRLKIYGDNNLCSSNDIINLANLYKKLGKFEMAEELHKKALSILQKAHGDDWPDLADQIGNLGSLY